MTPYERIKREDPRPVFGTCAVGRSTGIGTRFDRALELAPNRRRSSSKKLRAPNAEPRRELGSSIRTDDEADDFMVPPTASASPFGPYRILDKLGHGGMGTVYLACREDREDERVAVKVVQHGLARHAWRRLRTEYRILAELNHPGIVRVLDAGTSEDGRPYFVMEYIEGEQIETYCTEHDLPTASRLELILKVCDAVDAAHRQGVVHRDLKPPNILVTPEGEPVLLDFGIAKLLVPDARSYSVEATRTNEQPLTPQYSSPEQLLGEEITPRTDVYSLGVLLYKLLTGRLPYVLQRYSLGAMERAFEERPPPIPSAVATDPDLYKAFGGIDAIILKALRVKAEERFESVAALAQALRRSLEARPSIVRFAVGRLRRMCFAASQIFERRRGAVYSWALFLMIVILGAVLTWPQILYPPLP